MGEMHVTYKQGGFMQANCVGGKSWRSPCWVCQAGKEADMQRLFRCLRFLPVGKTKPFYFIFMGLPRCLTGKTWVSEAFLADFCYLPWGTRGKSLWDSSCLTLPHLTSPHCGGGEIKEPGGYKYDRSHAENRSAGQNES